EMYLDVYWAQASGTHTRKGKIVLETKMTLLLPRFRVLMLPGGMSALMARTIGIMRIFNLHIVTHSPILAVRCSSIAITWSSWDWMPELSY
ncbi:MAG: hypothetical protein M3Y81_29375, partial [Chloroflexota bacterium]|nr:hypothetical protein [Chloroflexota bacterium]